MSYSDKLSDSSSDESSINHHKEERMTPNIGSEFKDLNISKTWWPIEDKYTQCITSRNLDCSVIIEFLHALLKFIRKGPKESRKFKKYICAYLSAVKNLASEVAVDISFYDLIRQILVLYCFLELKQATCYDDDSKIASDILLKITWLMQGSNYITVADVLIDINDQIRSTRSLAIMKIVHRKYLSNRCTGRPVELDDNNFIKHLILFHLLYKMENISDKANVLKMFLSTMKPSLELRSNPTFAPYLQPYNPEVAGDYIKLIQQPFQLDALVMALRENEMNVEWNRESQNVMNAFDLTSDVPPVIKTEIVALNLPDEIISVDDDDDDDMMNIRYLSELYNRMSDIDHGKNKLIIRNNAPVECVELHDSDTDSVDNMVHESVNFGSIDDNVLPSSSSNLKKYSRKSETAANNNNTMTLRQPRTKLYCSHCMSAITNIRPTIRSRCGTTNPLNIKKVTKEESPSTKHIFERFDYKKSATNSSDSTMTTNLSSDYILTGPQCSYPYVSPPAVRYTSPPAVRYTSPPAVRYTSPPAVRYTSPPAVRYTSPPAVRNTSPPAVRYTSPPAVQYTSPPAVQYTSPPAVRCTSPQTPVTKCHKSNKRKTTNRTRKITTNVDWAKKRCSTTTRWETIKPPSKICRRLESESMSSENLQMLKAKCKKCTVRLKSYVSPTLNISRASIRLFQLDDTNYQNDEDMTLKELMKASERMLSNSAQQSFVDYESRKTLPIQQSSSISSNLLSIESPSEVNANNSKSFNFQNQQSARHATKADKRKSTSLKLNTAKQPLVKDCFVSLKKISQVVLQPTINRYIQLTRDQMRHKIKSDSICRLPTESHQEYQFKKCFEKMPAIDKTNDINSMTQIKKIFTPIVKPATSIQSKQVMDTNLAQEHFQSLLHTQVSTLASPQSEIDLKPLNMVLINQSLEKISEIKTSSLDAQIGTIEGIQRKTTGSINPRLKMLAKVTTEQTEGNTVGSINSKLKKHRVVTSSPTTNCASANIRVNENVHKKKCNKNLEQRLQKRRDENDADIPSPVYSPYAGKRRSKVRNKKFPIISFTPTVTFPKEFRNVTDSVATDLPKTNNAL